MSTAVLDLSTGREIIEHAPLRAGPFVDSSIFDHGCDGACLIVRKMLGIKTEERWVKFVGTDQYTALRDALWEYAFFELAEGKK